MGATQLLRAARMIIVASLAGVAPAAAATVDRERDGLPDRWEQRHRLTTPADSARLDPDRDRLSNRAERLGRTDPRRRDTDRDGVPDGAELGRGTNLRPADPDRDGLSDGRELGMRTDPRRSDTDADELQDAEELATRTNPLDADSDDDGHRDGIEVRGGADPRDARIFGPVRYVDGASRGGTCSDDRTPDQAANPATPWCTLERAAIIAPAGAPVRVRDATYGPLLETARPGWVRFTPHPGEAPSLRGLTFEGASRIAVHGFEITGPASRVGILGGSSDIELVGNYLHDLRTGFYLRDGGARIALRWNRVEDMVWADLQVKDGYGLSMASGAWKDLTIDANVFRGIDGDALQLGGMTGVRITRNTISDVRVSPANDDHADAIQISGSAVDVLVAGNLISDANKAIIVGSSFAAVRDRITFENNVIHEVSGNCMSIYDTQRLVVRHNTCWKTGYGFWLRDELLSPLTHTTGARIYNNLFGPATLGPGSVDLQILRFDDWGSEDHNLVTGIFAGQSFFDHTDIVQPPDVAALVLDAAVGDLRPAAGSLLIDRGAAAPDLPARDAAGHPRVAGAAPDIGAYEAVP